MTDHRKSPSASGWSNLQQEILSEIGTRLDNRVDVFRFQSVCKNWRSSRKPNTYTNSLLSPFLPCKIPNDNLPFNDRLYDSIIVVARAVLLVKPPHSTHVSSGWLLTVEEVVPGKLRILYPLSTDPVNHLPSNFPKYLDLSKYEVSQVAKTYCVKYASDGEDVADVRKVVLCSGSSKPCVMVLYGKGTLVGVRLKNGNWGYVRHSLVCSFKEMISFKGIIYAVDQYLSFHKIDYETMNVVYSGNRGLAHPTTDSMHLVVSNTQLNLVRWNITSPHRSSKRRKKNSPDQSSDESHFTVSSLNEVQGKWNDNGDCVSSSAIFVGRNWCFVVDIRFMNGRYIAYSGDCFNFPADCNAKKHEFLFVDASFDLTIGVFRRENIGYYSANKASWGCIADWLWPPPIWFLPAKATFSGDDQNNGESSISDLLFLPWSGGAADEGAIINKQVSSANATNMTLRTSDDENSHALIIQNLNQNYSTVVFEGVNIKSNLVPTLRKIWAKYGNILEGSRIRNSDMIGRALESLAIALLILEKSSGHSLSKAQANYLSSVLCDLQLMQFKVDWLAPLVEKALAVYKSKPLIPSFKDYACSLMNCWPGWMK